MVVCVEFFVKLVNEKKGFWEDDWQLVFPTESGVEVGFLRV